MSTTIKTMVIIAAVAILGLSSAFAYRALTNRHQAAETTDISRQPTSSRMAWGITVLPFPFRTYLDSMTVDQMKEAKKLGVSYVRVDYAPFNPKVTDTAVDAALKQGLEVVLIIPFGPNNIFTDKNLTLSAQTYVTGVVNRYKGRVMIYQLGTEAASVALNNDASKSGIVLKDYPTAKLNAVTDWIKAAASSVKATDPKAKTLVNDQWVHTGFFDHYFAQGGDFDILGWNWFSDMGTSMDTVTLDAKTNQTYALLTKLKSYNKPIWLTEVSRRLGNQGGHEADQAAFIQTMAIYAQSKAEIQGFFVFNLLEDQAAPPQEQGYGIITAVDDDKTQKITGGKAAFKTYQQIIKSSR